MEKNKSKTNDIWETANEYQNLLRSKFSDNTLSSQSDENREPIIKAPPKSETPSWVNGQMYTNTEQAPYTPEVYTTGDTVSNSFKGQGTIPSYPLHDSNRQKIGTDKNMIELTSQLKRKLDEHCDQMVDARIKSSISNDTCPLESSPHKGLRYNSGKLRYDLLHTKALEGITRVMTKGAEKYEDRNWEIGMAWSTTIQSLERHLAAFKSGEDFDKETGELHVDHLQCNAHFLSTFYHTYPQGDDRDLWFKRPLKKVFLDIDGIVADFEKHFLEYLNLPKHSSTDWNDYRFRDNFIKIQNDGKFWNGIPSLINPLDLDYPIAGYVTARPISNDITSKWLDQNGFPKGELINVGMCVSKVEALKGKCDVFIDDSIYNFIELQNAGITCFLMTRSHNKKYEVGMKRVDSVKEFIKKVKNLV